MVKLEDVAGSLLQKPSDEPPVQAAPERLQSGYKPLNSFVLPKDRPYKQQYGDMYFLRLAKIRPAVEQVASEAFGDVIIGGEHAQKVERVLDVRQGELCWTTGTVYMDMPSKPNILEDVAKDRWISGQSSSKKYLSQDGRDAAMLEDDSGRVRLVGDFLENAALVTGSIIAVIGTENANGDFEVIDVRYPELGPQPDRWALSKPPATNGKSKAAKKEADEDIEMEGGPPPRGSRGKVAIVSGLNFSGTDTSYALELSLLLEYLLGEALDPAAQGELSHISRLIIAGNSIASDDASKPLPTEDEDAGDEDTKDEDKKDEDKKGEDKKTHKKYGYDSSSYNPVPSQLLDGFLSELLPSMPITILPGQHDPANASFPQQPVHPAMYPKSRAFSAAPGAAEPGWLDSVTNPWEGEVDGWRFLGTSGQNVDDVLRYVSGDDRLGMMELMCRWRLTAPTAPDTLWSYPFQDDDPFVMNQCPHLYFAGSQPEFGTKTITGPEGQSVRLLTVPAFSKSKEIVLVDTETLDITLVKISAS
ncbi:DNA polymerase delta small subunit [Magnaporthiopsis poae ATCC 64411]|uniref:DNA-directed DNA polymerase n=1 Tax=Magnaporthiopsis poae (strain ATCC 64411 / 73-15) TaxID=644358 RepID=A0A0C4DV77_MAGP6|nr:DNA polymerase delta small subunit [Magnaporthiopsis poae ATCC 64411]